MSASLPCIICRGQQRLLDQRHARIGAGREVLVEVFRGPALVGVDDQLGARRRRPHRADALRVAGLAKLDLEQGARADALAVAAAMASDGPSEIV